MTKMQKSIARSKVLPPALNVVSRPIPSPAAGELLVRVKAAALNPVDWKAWQYPDKVTFMKCEGLGTDIAGVVEALGEGVEGWAVGDSVLSQGAFVDNYTGLTEYTLVTANLAAKIPENISYEQASTICLAFAAALHGLWGDRKAGFGIGLQPSYDSVPHYEGQAALVIGGSSSVGQYAIQVLKLSGFSTIITYASSKHADYLSSLGATHVLDRTAVPISDLSSTVRTISEKGVLVCFDTIALEDTQNAGYDSLTKGGSMTMTLAEESSVKAKREADSEGGKTVVSFLANSHLPGQDVIGKQVYSVLTSWLRDGAIVPNRFEIVPGGLSGVEGAFERMKNGQVSGVKLVVRPEDTP